MLILSSLPEKQTRVLPLKHVFRRTFRCGGLVPANNLQCACRAGLSPFPWQTGEHLKPNKGGKGFGKRLRVIKPLRWEC
jgi:hypothetical protein